MEPIREGQCYQATRSLVMWAAPPNGVVSRTTTICSGDIVLTIEHQTPKWILILLRSRIYRVHSFDLGDFVTSRGLILLTDAKDDK